MKLLCDRSRTDFNVQQVHQLFDACVSRAERLLKRICTTALFVGGIVLGLLLALLARPFIGVGAKRRAATTRRDAADGVRSVAERHILAPMTEELTEHDAIVDAVARARGAGT